MKRSSPKPKKIATGLLIIWCINLFAPNVSYALTSGPSQPETKGFQPAGISDMVDLQTGELKYNIPLLDIDGYPINLNYQANAGMDDEASWVGLGWSLNPGAINRQVRGIPDDFAGDNVEKDHYTKPKVTVGGKITGKIEIVGFPLYGSASIGLFSDNYTGIGAEIGANAGISYSFGNSTSLTAGLGVGVLSNTQTGVDLSPYVSLSIKNQADESQISRAGLSCSLGYNTRSGLKTRSLSASFSGVPLFGSTLSYNTEPIMPSIQTEHKSFYGSFSFDLGGELYSVFPSGGATGYVKVTEVKNPVNKKPGYGFLYAERGKNNVDAVMDFIREKDNPVLPESPNLAIPIHTPDMWSYTSQSGSGQFRLYRGGTGMFFDNKASDNSTTATEGHDIGIGNYFHGGVTEFRQDAHTTTKKWTSDNAYMAKGDFQDVSVLDPAKQHVYFRPLGEKGIEDEAMNSQILGKQTMQVSVANIMTAKSAVVTANSYNSTQTNIVNKIAKANRRANKTVVSYLTAHEAAKVGLDADILVYPTYTYSAFSLPGKNKPLPISHIKRESLTTDAETYRKAHHISEMTITDEGGKRTVYGIPVYNTKHEEYSFAVNTNGVYPADKTNTVPADRVANLTTPKDNNQGIDHYFQKETKDPYSTSFLLTAILSPDYVDKTSNGITDDDLGTSIKFNYSKLPYFYKWRSPYELATLNKCMQADPDDDKASIVYGEKEIWYTSSIESKTKVAYFITTDRLDGLGVTGAQSGGKDLNQKQKCLKEIRLYSKADMSKPIKVVKFEYTYDLCKNLLNTTDQTNVGKLTLSKVWFEYGNSDKGKFHKYSFDYNKTTTGNTELGYNNMFTDRWGNYKDPAENSGGLNNEEYPYTTQDTAKTNKNVALWHLKKVTLPTGGVINISYESGDYAYVQDKRAMAMTGVSALIGNTSDIKTDRPLTSLIRGIKVNIDPNQPQGVQTDWFKRNYLNGSNYLYTKLNVQVSTPLMNTNGINYFDYVPVYCEVDSVKITGDKAAVIFKRINEGDVDTNPICNAVWQRIKNEYPRYAYPGFQNRVSSVLGSVSAAVGAIASAVSNLNELKTNFYQKANGRKYGSNVRLDKSFVKITKRDGFKLGGGARVKAIRIYDSWDGMSGTADANSTHGPIAGYGQSYTYTTVVDKQTISSGVATYEPSIGNDENALKQPVPYIQKIKGAINNYFELEEPFCESLYPSATIGYSKVTVKDLDASGQPSDKTGFVVNEFYTAKDFPVKVKMLPIIPKPYKPVEYFNLFKTNSIDELCLSQGYSIELNDMHGKPSAVRIYNQAGAEISSTVYNYNKNDNKVNVIDSKGVMSEHVIGRDIEYFTDFREQESVNKGTTINIGVDIIAFIWFPLIIPHFPLNQNDDYKLFRSTCALKVIQNYGILSSVVKTENGSTITTENIAFDGLTGEALVTKTQNEFNKSIYSVNLPAYWAYKGMGAAYQNLGVITNYLLSTSLGVPAVNPNFFVFLQAGDEVCDLTSGDHYWVIETPSTSGSGNTKKLIDRTGKIAIPPADRYLKIVRSGFRNLLNAGTSALVCLNNPIAPDPNNGNKPTLQLAFNSGDLTNLKVINASANTYDESWAVSLKCDSAAANAIVENPLYPTFSGYTHPAGSTYLTEYEYETSRDTTLPGVGYFSKEAFFNNVSIKASLIGGLTKGTAGIDTCINVPHSGNYFLGMGKGWFINVSIDNSGWNGYIYTYPIFSFSSKPWTIYSNPMYLTAGKHRLTLYFNTSLTPSNDYYGVELYDNTWSQLRNVDNVGTGINTIFSTAQMKNKTNLRAFYQTSAVNPPTGPKIYRYYRANGVPVDPCNDPIVFSSSPILTTINPYLEGFMGNWRPYQTKVYQQSRNYNDIFNAAKSGIDIKNAGYINNFYSFWTSSTNAWIPNTNTNATANWVNANTVTLYDKYGQQLENQDALLRYSAAKFDFNGELPSAVASNAMNREIYAGSLEDGYFMPDSSAFTCNNREFISPGNANKEIRRLAVGTKSHSGNYSLLLSSQGITMPTIVHNGQQKTTAYLGFDNLKQYVTLNTLGLYPNGFEPKAANYIFNAWINDGLPNDKTVRVNLAINGSNTPLTCKAIVEGWKLVEGKMDFTSFPNASLLNITVKPTSGSTVYIDDIRMHPKDAQMKTYAYDDKTMRLMAELDENAFATFYEYDDEGLLVRVKKETEKGVMTLKETRSSYKKVIPIP